MRQIRVVTGATDVLSAAGLERALRERPEMEVVAAGPAVQPDVAVLATRYASVDEVTPLRGTLVPRGVPIVLVAAMRGDLERLAACQVVTVLPRTAGGELLAQTVRRTVDRGEIDPARLRTELVGQAASLPAEAPGPPAGTARVGLTDRELVVLRLLGDGLDTAAIAAEMAYSERTVKNIIYGVTSRLGFRNRVQAVAYAIRSGLI